MTQEDRKIWHPISEMPESDEKLLLHKVDGKYETYVLGYFMNGRVWLGGEPCRLKLFKEYAYLKDIIECSHPKEEEPVSEDLENMSYHSAMNLINDPKFLPTTTFSELIPMLQKLYKDGANWQKEHMMEDAITTFVFEDRLAGSPKVSVELPYPKYEFGDKVKVIIVKDEQ